MPRGLDPAGMIYSQRVFRAAAGRQTTCGQPPARAAPHEATLPSIHDHHSKPIGHRPAPARVNLHMS